jgi:two-component system response regulator MprA
VILDVMMPGLDGIEVCRQLRSRGRMGILMLTARTATRDRVHGLDSGADDYLAKPFEYAELLARVRALLRRAAPSNEPEVLEFGDVRLNVDTREVVRGERALTLTPREFHLLEHFMRHPRHVLGREQLLSAVWSDDAIDDNVVAVYISYLRLKLEAAEEPRLIQTVRGFGYVLREA